MQAEILIIIIEETFSSANSYMVDEYDVKAKSKCQDKHQQDQSKPRCSFDNVHKHQDVDAKERHVLEVGEKVEPGGCYEKRPHWPLPTLK